MSPVPVTPPLNVGAQNVVAITRSPVLPDTRTIGLAYVRLFPASMVADADPVASPRFMFPAPNADAFVFPSQTPALIVSPDVNVFAPLSVSCEVAEFWITPVTFVPMTAEIVVVPVPVPELVIVPVWLIGSLEISNQPALVASRMTLPVPVMPPAMIHAKLFDPFVIVR